MVERIFASNFTIKKNVAHILDSAEEHQRENRAKCHCLALPMLIHPYSISMEWIEVHPLWRAFDDTMHCDSIRQQQWWRKTEQTTSNN